MRIAERKIRYAVVGIAFGLLGACAHEQAAPVAQTPPPSTSTASNADAKRAFDDEIELERRARAIGSANGEYAFMAEPRYSCEAAQARAEPPPPSTPPIEVVVVPVAEVELEVLTVRDDSVGAALASTVLYFDFDKDILKPDSEEKLQRLADVLKEHPEVAIQIQGNSDERGTEEYNLHLGGQRAWAARITWFGSESMAIESKPSVSASSVRLTQDTTRKPGPRTVGMTSCELSKCRGADEHDDKSRR